MKIEMNMSVIYGVIMGISLLLMIGYYVLVKNKKGLLLLIHIAVLAVNTGYFLIAISKTLEGALMANRMAYLGSVFLPLCMLLLIMDALHLKYNKYFLRILIVISVLVFGVTASAGYLDIYYKEVSIACVNGATKLIKVYGPLHNLYFIYLGTYLAGMVGTIIYYTFKKRENSLKIAGFLVIVVCGNIGIWFIEQLIAVDFEFLSIAYIFTETLMVLFYNMLNDTSSEKICNVMEISRENVMEPVVKKEKAETRTDASVPSQEEKESVVKETENKDKEERKQRVVHLIEKCAEIEQLSEREMDVLLLILEDKKRKDIAFDLNISENTVKRHVSHIFSKLEVINRKELFEKVK